MLSQTISKIRTITNPELQYLGMLPTKYDKTTLNAKRFILPCRPLHETQASGCLIPISR
jgi:hypothetical protein